MNTLKYIFFVLLLFLISCKSNDNILSPKIPTVNKKFIFPIDTGYTWTYKYYYQQLNHDQTEFDTTTYNGIQKWDVVSKQVMNDSTTTYNINSSEEDTVKADKTTIYYNNPSNATFYDTTYTVKSENSFSIIATKDTVYCNWVENSLIQPYDSLVLGTSINFLKKFRLI